MKKKIQLLAILIFLFISIIGKAQIYLYEDFEHGGSAPVDWEEQYISGSASWTYYDGGLYVGGENHPEHAYEGSFNALFVYGTTYITKLITPPLDLEGGYRPLLTFWHAMQKYGNNVDELRVFFRQDESSDWMLLKEYTIEVSEWTKREIYLPDSLLSSTCYIAFEGKSKWGAGICVDAVTIEEQGLVTKTIKNLSVNSVKSNFIPTGSKDNVILRIDFEVDGNTGNLFLEDINLKSLNTSDSDIENDGIKLYFTEDTIFNTNTPLGISQNFVDGQASFNNLNFDLPFGLNSIWICYDIKQDINHQMHGHIADAMIEADQITISGNTYPFIDLSPSGSRIIYESIFFDDFESTDDWSKTGEFQFGEPQGLGSEGFFSADPSVASSGINILGTDLYGQGENAGDYESDLSNREYIATSPLINAKYYKNITFSFHRWLNIEGSVDTAFIDFSTNNMSTWTNLWKNNEYYNDNRWEPISFNMPSLDRKENINIRFALGGTDGSTEAGGWNIDDVVLTGDYITKDLGITSWIAPVNGCGHTNEEYIEITISNFAGDTLNEKIPLIFSLDGGTTVYRDTTPILKIPIESSVNYTVSKPVDLTTPGWYNNVYITTNLPGDEVSTNNKLTTKLFIAPTYNLPLTQNFETNYGYWKTGGTKASWEYGKPVGTVIKTAFSGEKVWITNLDGVYGNLENSYLESPCFNTIENDKPVVEFMMRSECEKDKDGLALYYSIDDGASWYIVPENGSYNWNWYNKSYINALGHEGWDTSFTVWTKVKQILPFNAANKSSIKLRFIFKSDGNAEYEGFAIDDFKIYDAPYDVGIRSLVYPYDKCEWSDTTHVKVYVENYGPIAVKSDTKIPLVMKFNTFIIKDTLILSEDLSLGDSILFTFGPTVDMSYAGDYEFTIYSKLESDPYFYNDKVCNDTLVKTVAVKGMPRYNPFPDLIGDNPVSLTLDAGEESVGVNYQPYNWSTGATTRTLFVNTPGTYSVTVTNSNLCTAIDEVEIVESEIDLAMTQLYTELIDSCERNLLTTISVQITNKSLIDLVSGVDVIDLAYQINNLEPVEQSFPLASDLLIDGSENFTFTQQADFRDVDEYTFKVFVNFMNDLNHIDDTISENFHTKGFVDIEFAYDTIYSSQTDTLTLSPYPLFDNYLWSTAEMSNTISPPDNISRWYKVTVSDNFICESDSDSIYIETYDMAITGLNSPANRCENNLTGSTDINVKIKNLSGNTYDAFTPLTFMYNLNGGGWIEKNMTLGTTLIPNGETNLSVENIDRTSPGEYTLGVYLKSTIDANNSNDNFDVEFETYPLPHVDLAYDTIFTTQADTVILVATPNLFSYLWNDASTNDSLIITDKYSKKYYVDIEDEYGCGTDSDTTWIITYNIGISSMLSPKNACSHTANEQVQLVIKNYSQDTLFQNTIIPVGYIFNNNTPVIENAELTADLLPGKTFNYTFTSPGINLSAKNTYYFKLFTGFKFDVNRNNDTLVNAIKTYGYPTIELGDDIYTTEPETISIVAPSGYITYWWNEDDGLEDNIFNVTYPATKLYSVTVTDINGCATNDQLTVYTYNVAASELITPVSQCVLSATEIVSFDVINNSQDTLLDGETINVMYILNSGSPINESFDLTGDLLPGATVNYTFTQEANLAANQVHEFELFAEHANVDVKTDDAITRNVDYQKPILDLGPDVNTGAAEYTIDAGAGYISYAWFDETTTTRTYTVDINDQNPSNEYWVTVTNSDGCTDADTIQVTFTITPDLSVTSMITPVSDCWNEDETYPVQIVITNSGIVNLNPGNSFTVGYIKDGEPAITETFNLSAAMNASDTREHTFANEISFPSAKVYKFKAFVKISNDGNVNNDTLPAVNVEISAPEVILGANDTITFTSATYEISTSESYLTYLWNDGSEESTLVINETGAYSVTVTDGYGCQGEGSIYCIKKTTGIDNLIKGDGYSISYYPNPVSEKLMIQFDNKKTTDVVIEIVNSNGRVIYNNKLTDIENAIEQIDVAPYARGVYYIRFKIHNELFTRKIIFH